MRVRCKTTCYVDGRLCEAGGEYDLDLPQGHPMRVYFDDIPADAPADATTGKRRK